MKIRKELKTEVISLVAEDRMSEARILAGHIRLLETIFKIPHRTPRGNYKVFSESENMKNDPITVKTL